MLPRLNLKEVELEGSHAGKTEIVPTDVRCPAMAAVLSSVLRPIYRFLGASNGEDFIKRLLKWVFTVVILIPLFLLPIYFFIYTVLHL